jgi:hypothetical protein
MLTRLTALRRVIGIAFSKGLDVVEVLWMKWVFTLTREVGEEV